MTNIERIRREIVKRGVVSKADIIELAEEVLDQRPLEYRYLLTEYISKLLERGDIARPRQGLYVATVPTSADGVSVPADRYVVASKIRDTYYLGFHTALELHGCAYSWFKRVTVCLPPGKQFRPFMFQETTYRPVFTNHPELGTQRMGRSGHEIILSGPSRTFIDCLDRPKLVGGWEEVLKSVESLPGVSGEEIITILNAMEKKVLYRKVGLVLELLGDNMYYEGVLEGIRGELQEKLDGQPIYMDRNSPGPLNGEWNLYEVPNLERMSRGV